MTIVAEMNTTGRFPPPRFEIPSNVLNTTIHLEKTSLKFGHLRKETFARPYKILSTKTGLHERHFPSNKLKQDVGLPIYYSIG